MFFSLLIVFCATGLLGYILIPNLYNTTNAFAQRRERKIAHQMDRLMPRAEVKKVSKYLILAPIILAMVNGL